MDVGLDGDLQGVDAHERKGDRSGEHHGEASRAYAPGLATLVPIRSRRVRGAELVAIGARPVRVSLLP